MANATKADCLLSMIHFRGGGSIPLEAQRLGLPAFGSDLNPVAVTIGKAMIEIPLQFKDKTPIHPGGSEKIHYKYSEGIAEDVKYYGDWMRRKAYDRIGHLYPQVELQAEQGRGKSNVVAWIWARTVPSSNPALKGLHVPLVRSFNLSVRKGQETWVQPIIEDNSFKFEVRSTKQGYKRIETVGTINRNGATCLVSGYAMPLSYVRQKAKEGKMKEQLMAIVAEGEKGRIFVSPTEQQSQIAIDCLRPEINDIQLPEKALGFRIQAYGRKTFGDLYTNRQLIALQGYIDLVHESRKQIEVDALNAGMSRDDNRLADGGTGAKAYAEAVSVYLSLAVDRLSAYCNSHCIWIPKANTVAHIFGRQAIPMVWDFTETSVFSRSSGDILLSINGIVKVLQRFTPHNSGRVRIADAQSVTYPREAVINTDPPYYDNIGYADLSDFFFTWMKSALKPVYPTIFNLIATPKSEELIAAPFRHGGRNEANMFFLEGMRKVISNMVSNTSNTAPAIIYYAFKQSEIEEEGISSIGWATFLQAVIEAGYSIVGTWPIRTERPGRLRAQGSNALASSVVIVCRKRETTSSYITRAKFVRKLKDELPKAIADLKAANISPVDIPQSSIGPGIGIFSRYKAVLEANDHPMSVKSALQLINRELGEEEGKFDAETSFALTWFQQFGFNVGDYGTALSIASAKGISDKDLVHAGIATSSNGKFSLLNREYLQKVPWDPITDNRITIWECCQHLICRMGTKGELEAAKLLRAMGDERAEATKELAYALHFIAANKLQDASEATAYNELISVWSDLTTRAAQFSDDDIRGSSEQGLLYDSEGMEAK